MQEWVLTRMEGLILDQEPNGVIDSQEEALRSLLHGVAPYEGGGAKLSLAPYRSELVSIPESVKECPFLCDILGESDRQFLEEESELMKRTEDELEGIEPTARPYWDPVLRYNRKEYNKLVQRLTDIHFFNFTTQPKCQISVFFVWKSNKTKLRMITDARCANRLFKDAPPVSLMTSEGLGRVELEMGVAALEDTSLFDHLVVHLGLSDVKDCFHRMRVPRWLSRYFCWEAVPAKVVGLTGETVDGKTLGPLDPVWPCAGSLCQGFSWSLYFAQKANEQMCKSVDLLREASLVHDRGPPVVLRVGQVDQSTETHYYVYVDNLGVLHFDQQLVANALKALQKAFDGAGLVLHGSEARESALQAAGFTQDLGQWVPTQRITLDRLADEVRFDEESSGGSTSSELKVGNLEGRTRRPQRKQKGLLKEYVNVTMEHAQLEMTPLEMAAVTKRVRSNYRKRLEDFMEFVLDRRYPLEKDEEMDSALVIYFNHKFSEGEGSYVGDYTLAALCDRDPSFGKLGHRKIPRAWRCLKGWRKLCPSRSRLAYPLAVWCAISWRMVVLGHRQKAIFNLVQLSSYHRPSTLLQLRKMGLVKPTQGITKFWSLVTSLSETSDVSKTGTKDDSILLDSSWMTFIHPLLEELARGKKMDKVWTFNYSEYLTVFREACDQLRLDVVPYQARHSGPSIDRAANNRTQEEVRKRGGWMSRTSTARYEKAGRLAATWQKLDPAIQLCCSLAERHIGDIILDQEYPYISLP
ncbi:Uncharacterized protein SCF082_LOCUS9531 [Durusdinium trenchii]|uniref:Uncharacterized protein n=1 Tax=Durusdinium trenchii TaxID=1381693 RepID=A0ABP0J036_9DINO